MKADFRRSLLITIRTQDFHLATLFKVSSWNTMNKLLGAPFSPLTWQPFVLSYQEGDHRILRANPSILDEYFKPPSKDSNIVINVVPIPHPRSVVNSNPKLKLHYL